MSHSRAQIYQDGKLVAIGIYYDVCDIMQRKLFRSFKEARESRDRGDDLMDVRCTCGGEPVPVVIYSDYGSGTWWDSTACLKCMVITGDNLDPFELVDFAAGEEMVHGKPPFFVDQWSLETTEKEAPMKNMEEVAKIIRKGEELRNGIIDLIHRLHVLDKPDDLFNDNMKMLKGELEKDVAERFGQKGPQLVLIDPKDGSRWLVRVAIFPYPEVAWKPTK